MISKKMNNPNGVKKATKTAKNEPKLSELSHKNRGMTLENEINISKSVNMKCIGGHTTGSSIVLINTKMTTYVLCGDECYTMENLYSLTPTGSSCCREKSIFFVNEYSQSCYTPIVFHDEVLVGENGAKEIANNELDLKVFNNEC